jgi:hypothetical protein
LERCRLLISYLHLRPNPVEVRVIKKLRIKTSSVLKGSFDFSGLNILLVFQVNCPGCFLYAIPLANEIHKKYGVELNVLGLATAFEDFEYNTEENTTLLIKDGTLVGETKRVLKENGFEKPPYSIDFPVAADYLAENSRGLYTLEDARHVCGLTPSFQGMNEDELEKSASNIMRNLEGLGRSSYTFTINLMRGTPSWVIFDRDMNILEHWFSHRDSRVVFKLLDKHLASVKK